MSNTLKKDHWSDTTVGVESDKKLKFYGGGGISSHHFSTGSWFRTLRENFESLLDESHDLSAASDLATPSGLKEEVNIEISEFSISEEGLVTEKWESIENIPSSIVSIGEAGVTLECLIDVEKRIFQRRIFDSLLLRQIANPQIGTLILVKIFKRPGEARFKFLNGNGIVNKDFFEPKKMNELFSDIPKDRLTKLMKFN